MKNLTNSIITLIGLAGFGLHANAQGTAFTYQGRLEEAGQPATGL